MSFLFKQLIILSSSRTVAHDWSNCTRITHLCTERQTVIFAYLHLWRNLTKRLNLSWVEIDRSLAVSKPLSAQWIEICNGRFYPQPDHKNMVGAERDISVIWWWWLCGESLKTKVTWDEHSARQWTSPVAFTLKQCAQRGMVKTGMLSKGMHYNEPYVN